MKVKPMKIALLTTAIILSCSLMQSATALERTSNVRNVDAVSPEITINAQNAVVTQAISKVNRDILAILHCNNKNMFYKPQDSTADAKGCVGASIQTTTSNHTEKLGAVYFDSYPGATVTSKGVSGRSTRTINLSSIVAKGATAISVQGTLGSFTGGCSGVSGSKTFNIANVNSNVDFDEKQCHYDGSPNRSSFFGWSYNGSKKELTFRARTSQVKGGMTNAKITGITAKYGVTKTVLKVGDGK